MVAQRGNMDRLQKSDVEVVRAPGACTWLDAENFRAILCGSLAGFAVAVVMAVIGTALGATGGAVGVDEATSLQETGRTLALGSLIWLALSAIVVGLVGGLVMNRLAVHDGTYRPRIFALVNWAGGIALATIIGTSAAVSLGGAAAGVAGAVSASPRTQPELQAGRGDTEVGSPEATVNLSPADRQILAERAAKTAAGMAWAIVVAQLLGLIATILGAGRKAVENREVYQTTASRPAFSGS
jgi:MFS family permease